MIKSLFPALFPRKRKQSESTPEPILPPVIGIVPMKMPRGLYPDRRG